LPTVIANGLKIEVETLGNPTDPSVLLIMGLGMQLIAWPDSFCKALVDSGFHVIRFDNRDVGLSEKIQAGKATNVAWATMRYFLHLPVQAPYLLDEMAADSVGVLDALGIRSAHIVGASLGGMIAQTVAANFPDRCMSLSSIMASSGDRRLPNSSLKVTRLLLSRPPPKASVEQLTDHLVRLFRAIGSPGFPTPEPELREHLSAGIRRGYYPQGTLRQLLAIVASGDRSARLRTISTPTLVLHGDRDPLVRVSHGIDCARKIPGAELKIIQGMGHDLAPGLLPILSEALLRHFRVTGDSFSSLSAR
jgi:pimeloyl-ACP methyl ester carboxylesterase